MEFRKQAKQVKCKLQKIVKLFRISIFLFICFSHIPGSAYAGDRELKSLMVAGRMHYGVVTPHHKSIQYSITDAVRGIDLCLVRATNGAGYWEQLYRYPRYGIGYNWSQLGNTKVYGTGHSLYGFFKAPFIARDRLSVNYAISLGLSYLNKTFEPAENPMNNAISSNLNVFVRFSGGLIYRLTDKLEISGDLNMQHYSNGKLKSPNLGINLVTTSLGLAYKINDAGQQPVMPELPEITKKNRYSIIYSAGCKTFDDLADRYYFASSLSLHYDRILSHKFSAGGGADFFYNSSIRKAMAEHDNKEAKPGDLFRAGLHIGGAIYYNRLSMLIQAGYYLYKQYYYITPVYNRVGLRYRINDNILLNISLKSHHAVADFVEWGVGYTW